MFIRFSLLSRREDQAEFIQPIRITTNPELWNMDLEYLVWSANLINSNYSNIFKLGRSMTRGIPNKAGSEYS